MAKVIAFKSREEWDLEKQNRMKAEWETYLAWEEETLRKAQAEKEQAKQRFLDEFFDEADEY